MSDTCVIVWQKILIMHRDLISFGQFCCRSEENGERSENFVVDASQPFSHLKVWEIIVYSVHNHHSHLRRHNESLYACQLTKQMPLAESNMNATKSAEHILISTTVTTTNRRNGSLRFSFHIVSNCLSLLIYFCVCGEHVREMVFSVISIELSSVKYWHGFGSVATNRHLMTSFVWMQSIYLLNNVMNQIHFSCRIFLELFNNSISVHFFSGPSLVPLISSSFH